MPHFAIIMLLSGIGIPVLAALNAALGRNIGSPAVAGSVLFIVAFSACAAVAVIMGTQASVAKLPAAPKHLFTAGLFVAFYVLAVTYIAPSFGIGNAIFFVLIGQLISAAVIDHFGLFGSRVSPMDLKRAAGLAIMAVGVWVTQKA